MPVLQCGSRNLALNQWELLPGRAGVALGLRTVRTRTHMMTVEHQSGAGALYVLVVHPDEIRNLFDDPAAGAIRTQLEAILANRPNDMAPIREPVGMA